MARIKIEAVVDHLESEFHKALAAAFKQPAPTIPINERALFRAFARGVDRYCSTWETVPDSAVEAD